MSEQRMQYLREEQERLAYYREKDHAFMEELSHILHERPETIRHLEQESPLTEAAQMRHEQGIETLQQEVVDLKQEILQLRQEYTQLVEEVEQVQTQQRKVERERERVVENLLDIRKILEGGTASPPDG